MRDGDVLGAGPLDLAHLAALRGQDAANFLGEPVHKGKADWAWLLSLPHAAGKDRKLAAAERVASELEPHARSQLGRQVLGVLTLAASMAAASIQHDGTASQWMEEAEAVATQLPDDPPGNWEQFSATNVGVWKVAVGVERGESGRAVLERARNVNADLLAKKSSRRAAFLADVGRGLAREPRTRIEAVRWLRQAEEAAPQRVRNSSAVRETVAFLLNRATAASAGRELHGIAARMGVPH